MAGGGISSENGAPRPLSPFLDLTTDPSPPRAGKAAVKALRSPAYAKLKAVPQFSDDDAAREFLHSLIPFTFFLRVVRGPTVSAGIKALQINPQQLFVADEYYVWLLPADQTKQLLTAGGLVAVVLAGVMFPLWPMTMRIGVWYLSMGVLGLIAAFFGLAIVRLIGWVITKVAVSPGIWLFPNLFADVGFVRLPPPPSSCCASTDLIFLLFIPLLRSTPSSRSGRGTFLPSRRRSDPRRKRRRQSRRRKRTRAVSRRRRSGREGTVTRARC